MKLNDKKLQKQIKFQPFDKQQEIIDNYERLRDIRLACGRRFGKSKIAAYLALREFLQDDKHVWIVAPSYELTKRVWEYVVLYINVGFPTLSKRITSMPAPAITSNWGSFIKCKSADNPASLLGEGLDLVIIDEAARVRENAWQQYIYPCLSDRQGKSLMISTPLGKNWFYRDFIKVKHSEDGFAAQYPSSARPSFKPEEWERAKASLPEMVFRQEYMAQFVDEGTGVFRGIHKIIGDTYKDAEPFHRYIIGVDLAKVGDFTVLTVLDKYTHNVVHWERFNKVSYSLQIKRIVSLSRKYNRAVVIADGTLVGASVVDQLKREGVPVQSFLFTGGHGAGSNKGSKADLIEKLALYIEQGAITIPNEPILIDELESFSYEVTRYGNYKYSAPEGQHDDGVLSLALAVWGLANPERENPRVLNTPSSYKKVFSYK